MTDSKATATRIGVISLGCAKNLVDTEVMLGHLDRAGCTFVESPEDADVLIVNTCGFIGPAREESIRTILEAAEYKKTGRVRRLVVAGCMVQRYPEELQNSLPEVDAFIGLDQLDRVVSGAGLGRPTTRGRAAEPATTGLEVLQSTPGGRSRYLYDHAAPRRLATPPWTAFVKIAEGCDHTCSFCAIPSFRGRFRSRDHESVVAEVTALASDGVVEVNLVAQDSSHYGRDRGVDDGLPALLDRLDAVQGVRWLRVHYLYPNTVTDALIDAMARLPKVVKYVDMPLQHAHPEVLHRMRRGGSGERHLELLGRFRRAIPEVALRSTFIVGYPGETEEEFEALESFVTRARFDHLGVFTYSHEDGTVAHDVEDDVPREVKEQRRDRLMELQQGLVVERNRALVGNVVEVLMEGAHPETDMLRVGRMSTQAPEVDGQVLINDGVARPGSVVQVELTDVAGYDLVGGIVELE